MHSKSSKYGFAFELSRRVRVSICVILYKFKCITCAYPKSEGIDVREAKL